MRLGVHISIGRGLVGAIEDAVYIGCNTMQIFIRSPRSWSKSSFSYKEIDEFKKELKLKDISPLAVHGSYLINLASGDRTLYNKSINHLVQDIVTSDKLGADYFVVHPGSSGRQVPASWGIERIGAALNTVIKKSNPRLMILLENTGGGGSLLGSNFRDFGAILKGVSNKRKIGFCLDSAHVFEAGFDIATKKGLDKTLKELDRFIGINRLKLIHLNDSKTALGSRVDRHEHLGKGFIGKKGLKVFLNNTYIKRLPLILETPKYEDGEDTANLNFARKLIKK